MMFLAIEAYEEVSMRIESCGDREIARTADGTSAARGLKIQGSLVKGAIVIANDSDCVQLLFHQAPRRLRRT